MSAAVASTAPEVAATAATVTTPEVAAAVPRAVVKTVRAAETSDGDGARIKRAVGIARNDYLDPFLMLDAFEIQKPAGFPSHPHRGQETVTIMLEGGVTHKDNKGHEGTIGPGDMQWMTAGRGIVHSEFPAGDKVARGLQLWVNLPKAHKMTEPRYQELLAKDIPEVTDVKGARVRVLAGESRGVKAEVRTFASITVLDYALDDGASYTTGVPAELDAFLYVYSGDAVVGAENTKASAGNCLVLGPGSELTVSATGGPARIFLFAGVPLKEPVAKMGPFVMTTQAELQQAYLDYQMGRF